MRILVASAALIFDLGSIYISLLETIGYTKKINFGAPTNTESTSTCVARWRMSSLSRCSRAQRKRARVSARPAHFTYLDGQHGKRGVVKQMAEESKKALTNLTVSLTISLTFSNQ